MTYTYAVKLVALLDVAFIAFLILSGYVGGWMGQIIYALAFIIPLLAGIFCSEEFKRRREEVAGVAEAPDGLLKFTPDIAGKLAPLAAPTVAIVFLTSLLTSLFLSLFGVTSAPVENKGIVTMLIVHALTPAILEEALFRYLPMKLILPYSKRFCVFYSAFCFAMIHCNFSQMPYAFVAGVIFMMIDVALGSVWPSVILHFINNAASVIWIKYCGTLLASWIFIGSLIVLVSVSLIFIFRKSREYRELLGSAFHKGERALYTPALLALVLMSVYLAVTNL